MPITGAPISTDEDNHGLKIWLHESTLLSAPKTVMPLETQLLGESRPDILYPSESTWSLSEFIPNISSLTCLKSGLEYLLYQGNICFICISRSIPLVSVNCISTLLGICCNIIMPCSFKIKASPSTIKDISSPDVFTICSSPE